MNAEQKIEGTARLLERLDIAFRLARHAPAHTMEACEEVARSINALIPKNLLLCPRNESAFTLLIMRPETRFCTSLVSRRLESPRLGFADEGRMMEKLMAAPGAAGPLGLLLTGQRDVALALDERLKEAEELAFHPSENTASLAMSRRDFEEKLLPALGVPVRWISVEQEEIGC
jgi:Ala-tRNA(Pro) deacylase